MRGHDGLAVMVLVLVLRGMISTVCLSDRQSLEAHLQIAVFDTFKAPWVPAVYVCLGKQAIAQTGRDQAQGGLLEAIWILACLLL